MFGTRLERELIIASSIVADAVAFLPFEPTAMAEIKPASGAACGLAAICIAYIVFMALRVVATCEASSRYGTSCRGT